MNIIIAGIIDTNSDALDRIQESLDILPLKGDVEDYRVYDSFVGQKIHLFIVVTNIDNTNLVASAIIDSVLNVERKFVRLQKDIYNEEDIKKRFNIEKIIFPLQLSSKTVSSLLAYPKANNVKFFKHTDYKLVSFRISNGISRELIDSKKYSLVGIERNKKFFVPTEKHTQVKENDLVYIFGLSESIEYLCEHMVVEDISATERCVVFGGEELGISIAKSLVDAGCEVKLIEKEMHLCEKAEEKLEGKVTVINSKYGIHDVFDDENLHDADLFIAATNNDEYNIIKCLEAKDRGISKVVAINNEMEYYSLMHSLGIIVIRGPKISAYNTIMEDISSTGVVIQKSFCGAMGIVFLRRIFARDSGVVKKINPLHLSNTKIFIVRENSLELVQEAKELQADDLLLAFSGTHESTKVKQWIYGL